MTAPWPADVDEWFRRRTLVEPHFDIAALAAAKRDLGLGVTICLPALNEAATIAPICRSIQTHLVSTGVVDELLVIDSGSIDETPELAEEAGAVVRPVNSIVPAPLDATARGKGDAMWRSLAVTSGDLIVWIDADITSFTPSFITSLLGPLIADPELVMTKAFYARPLVARHGRSETGGGRVTELAARPLLRLLCPQLSAVVQPLAGEYALRRDAALELPFVTDYGVDVGLLIDAVGRFGLQSVAQVNLGTRTHRNRELIDLGATSFQVMQAILTRVAASGALELPPELPTSLVQFDPSGAPAISELGVQVRPPMSTVLAQR